jgi:hypothetical protein
MLNNQGPSGCTDYTPLSTEIARRRQNVQSIMGEERGMTTRVYFVVAGDEFVKIGLARNVRHRLHTISVACPLPVKLYDDIVGDRVFERRLHDIFRKERVRGEWFRWKPLIHMVMERSCELTPRERDLNMKIALELFSSLAPSHPIS